MEAESGCLRLDPKCHGDQREEACAEQPGDEHSCAHRRPRGLVYVPERRTREAIGAAPGQTLAQIELWTNSKNYSNNVYMLPKKLYEKVAMLHLDALGVELEKLNKIQSKYLGLDIEGPFKPDYYRY